MAATFENAEQKRDYTEVRTQIVRAYEAAQAGYDRSVFLLSGGGLGISLAFASNLIGSTLCVVK